MRGKEEFACKDGSQVGITPAYAGKSKVMSGAKDKRMGSPPRMRGKVRHVFLPFSVFQDHPRVCGEKLTMAHPCLHLKGSPPRMRGKAVPTVPAMFPSGITPAYAGKRLKRSRSTVPPVAIVPLFPSVCNKPVVSDGSPAGRDAPLFLPAENAVPASPAYNLRSL